MPKYNCMDLKKYVGVGGGYAKIFYGLVEKMLGVIPKYVMDLKKCGGGGGLKMFGGLKNVWEVCQQILCMDLKKKLGGGGWWLCPNILLT